MVYTVCSLKLMTHIVLLCIYNRLLVCFFFFFKQKTAYEMRISDWSSDVCSSDSSSRSNCGTGCGFPLPVQGSISTTLPSTSSTKLWNTRSKRSRSEERRGGKEWVSTCRSRWSPDH